MIKLQNINLKTNPHTNSQNKKKIYNVPVCVPDANFSDFPYIQYLTRKLFTGQKISIHMYVLA